MRLRHSSALSCPTVTRYVRSACKPSGNRTSNTSPRHLKSGSSEPCGETNNARSTDLRSIASEKRMRIGVSNPTRTESSAGTVSTTLGGVLSSGPPGGGICRAQAIKKQRTHKKKIPHFSVVYRLSSILCTLHADGNCP